MLVPPSERISRDRLTRVWTRKNVGRRLDLARFRAKGGIGGREFRNREGCFGRRAPERLRNPRIYASNTSRCVYLSSLAWGPAGDSSRATSPRALPCLGDCA